ncbi:MAG: alpha/beta hydrolase, partial [Thermodesulfobacteriota bacterium]
EGCAGTALAIKEITNRIDRFSVPAPIGIGFSLGAMLLMAAEIERPGSFSKLVLIGATPTFVRREGFSEAKPPALVRRMAVDMKAEPEETLARFRNLIFTDAELKGKYAKEFFKGLKGGGGKGADFASLTAALATLASLDLRAGLAEIKIPTLIVHGERDAVVPVEAGRYLKDHIPDASFCSFESTGHAPMLTRPEEFNSILSDFLGL